MTPVKEDWGKSTILFISLSTSSSFIGLDAIAESWGQGPSLDNHALITAQTRSTLGMMQ
jgi:hypothetical protein